MVEKKWSYHKLIRNTLKSERWDIMWKGLCKWITYTVLVISCTSLIACSSESQTTKDNIIDSANAQKSENVGTVDFEESEDYVTRPIEITDISDTEKEIYVYREDIKLYGKLYLPEGDGPFPVVVYSSGAGMPFGSYKDIAKKLAENGIAGVCFDFAGAIDPSRSEGSVLECSVLTEAADLAAVVNSIKEIEYIDGDNIFLWGHSLGGFVTAYVGCQNPDMIRGMMLAEPSFQFHDQIRELFPDESEIPEISTEPFYCGAVFYTDALSFDIYDIMPQYKNDIVIFAGTKTPSLGTEYTEYFERAEETFTSAELIYVDDADHQFEGASRQAMIDIMIEYINNHKLSK